MVMLTKVEIIQTEKIKPSSPTPDDLKILKLSLLDQFVPITYTSLVLFYPENGGKSETLEITLKLKISLSETLMKFYPLAGRLIDNTSVECNDEGAEFIEAKMNCQLSEILKNPDVKFLNQFLPAAMESSEAATGNLLLVKATFFDCGGLAIGVCISHKMADAATLSTFIKCWAKTATDPVMAVSPVFMGASLFPSIDISMPQTSIDLSQNNSITKRFVFTGSKIEALRAKVASLLVPEPTRVEAVSGILWKSAMSAMKLKHGNFRPSIWTISVNMRKRFEPPLPENHAGNFIGSIAPRMMNENSELELKEIVSEIRKEMEGFGENYVRKLEGVGALLAICEISKEFLNCIMSKDIDFYICSSWCKFGLYEADFGWGKPIWVSSVSTAISNVGILMDTSDGEGIEAWLSLSEEDMAIFESNQDLLEFAAVNPAVVC